MKEIIYTQHDEVKAAAERIYESMKDSGGLKDIFCVACGGSLGSLYPLEYLLRCNAGSIHVESVSANEFLCAPPARLGKSSLVVLLSASGTTAETCAAAESARESGATLIGLSKKPNTKLHSFSDYAWVCSVDAFDSENFKYSDSCLLLRFGFELLRLYDNYEHYEEAVNAFDVLEIVHKRALRQTERRALKFGEEHKNDKIIYTVASGPSLSASYMLSICLIMEMEWVNSFAIDAGEMFHGPFEVADNNTPFVVFMSNGRTRSMDERALRFLQRYSTRVSIIDSNELGLSHIGPNVEEFFSGTINWIVAFAYGKGLATAKAHPIHEWRYMGKISY